MTSFWWRSERQDEEIHLISPNLITLRPFAGKKNIKNYGRELGRMSLLKAYIIMIIMMSTDFEIQFIRDTVFLLTYIQLMDKLVQPHLVCAYFSLEYTTLLTSEKSLE